MHSFFKTQYAKKKTPAIFQKKKKRWHRLIFKNANGFGRNFGASWFLLARNPPIHSNRDARPEQRVFFHLLLRVLRVLRVRVCVRERE